MDDLYVVRFGLQGEYLALEELTTPDDDEDEEPDIKTTLAQFGLAFYSACVLEHEIVNVLAVTRLVEARRDAEALLSDPWDDGFKVTMGRLERQLRHELQGDLELISDLIKAVQLRNHLAHAFWRERSDDFCSEAGRARMITDLIEARRFFKDVDARLTASAGAAAFGQWGVTAAAVNAWHADTVGRIERGELDVPPDMVEAARTAMLARIRAASVDAKGRPDR